MNKIFAVVTIARQFDGDIVSVRFENCYTTKELAEKYANSLSKISNETLDVPGVGKVQFFCERGIHELDIVE